MYGMAAMFQMDLHFVAAHNILWFLCPARIALGPNFAEQKEIGASVLIQYQAMSSTWFILDCMPCDTEAG